MEKEIEFKLLLSREEWTALKTYIMTKKEFLSAHFGNFSGEHQLWQTNHYFDHDRVLEEHKTVCRLRDFSNQSTPTLFFKSKNGNAGSEDFAASLEFMHNLTRDEAEQILRSGRLDTIACSAYRSLAREFTNWLETTEQGWQLPDELQYLGYLKTDRLEFIWQNLCFCFDHSRYFQKEDFELEIEGSAKNIQTSLNLLIPDFKILSRRSDTPSKFQRFRSALSEKTEL